jgi:hypothetical protein
LVAIMLAHAVPALSATLTIAADAGLGGVSKAGRWTAVRVLVDNTGRDLAGDLVASWGDFEVRRHVTLPSPSRKQFEILVRTTEVEGSVRLRVLSEDVEVGRVDAPVRLVAPDEPVTLCVHARGATAYLGAGCSAATTADRLPASARGYDAIDRVIWPEGEQPLTPEARLAFDRWRWMRALDETGDLTSTPPPRRPILRQGIPDGTLQVVGMLAVLYTGTLAIGGFFLRTRRAAAGSVYASALVLACLGSSAMLAVGRAGTASEVVVRHDTLVQQLPGETGAGVVMRGVVEFPSLDTYTVRAEADDAYFEPAVRSSRRIHTFDDGGAPVLEGTFPLGARQAFSLEAFLQMQPVAIVTDGALVRVTNQSAMELRDCRFAEGFSDRDIGSLRPGQRAEATRLTDGRGPVFTCALTSLPFELTEPSHVIREEGMTRLAVYRPLDETPTVEETR